MSTAFNLHYSRPQLMAFLLGLSLLLTAFSSIVTAAELDSKVAWQKISAGALVIDVRTAEEFAQGHLPDSINIPYQQINQAFKQQNIAKDRSVVVYCRSGNRSGIADKMLESAGFTNVYNGGGYQTLMMAKD